VRSLPLRIAAACRFDASVFEEVEADESANVQAAAVVLLVGVAGSLGSMAGSQSGVGAMLLGALGGVVAWAAWASLTLAIGTRVMPEPQTRADTGQLLRTLAFAASPGLMQVLGVAPSLRRPVFAVTSLWMLATMVLAVRQALDYRSTVRAAFVCGFAWALVMLVALVLGVLFPLEVS
jgi:Yip1 domain